MSAGRSGEQRGFPSVPSSSILAVTAEQMREVDRVAVEDLDLLLIQMMENAGIRLAELALRRFRPETVAVLCGRGGNGGGGLVAARHLANRGVRVDVTLGEDRSRLGEVPGHQLAILERMDVPVVAEPVAAELVLDALIGYSLRSDPRGRAAELIRWANEQEAPVCSLDVPSGLDATTGDIRDPCMRATATLTLALPKMGLAAAPGVVGELYLADISIPPRPVLEARDPGRSLRRLRPDPAPRVTAPDRASSDKAGVRARPRTPLSAFGHTGIASRRFVGSSNQERPLDWTGEEERAMRPDIKAGARFPDFELTDHTGTRRKLSELQGDDPMILVLSRGHFCPKDRRQLRNLVDFYPELKVGYTKLVTISTDNILQTNELRDGLGAQWPFLSDPGRKVQKDLDIAEYTDPHNDPMIPHTFVLEPGLRIFRIYNGYWHWGRPSNEDLRSDLRELFQKIRPDWNISDPELRDAWERGERERFFPYAKSMRERIAS